MKKIAKAVLCLASTVLLTGCAESISVNEAKKIADGLSLDAVTAKYSGGKKTSKVVEFSSSGDNSAIVLKAMSNAGTKLNNVTEEDVVPSDYFISRVYIATMANKYGDDIAFSADGTALMFDVSVTTEYKAEESAFGVAYTDVSTISAFYNDEGLRTFRKLTQTMTFSSSDIFKIVTEESYSWTLAPSETTTSTETVS